MFEVYSRRDNVHGVLVKSCNNQFVYAQDKEILECGKIQHIALGSSYDLVSDGTAQELIFESTPGEGDGVNSKSLLILLIHREEILLSEFATEARSLAIRSLKMALDSLTEVSNTAAKTT